MTNLIEQALEKINKTVDRHLTSIREILKEGTKPVESTLLEESFPVLKVANFYATETPDSCYTDKYTHKLSIHVKNFIEKGDYSRIVNISYYGSTSAAMVCTIIYEEKI